MPLQLIQFRVWGYTDHLPSGLLCQTILLWCLGIGLDVIHAGGSFLCVHVVLGLTLLLFDLFLFSFLLALLLKFRHIDWNDSDFGADSRNEYGSTRSARFGLNILVKAQVAVVG